MGRENGRQLAEPAGDPSPTNVQHLIGRTARDNAAVRDDLWADVVEDLGDPDGVPIAGETGLLEEGDRCVGVQRRSCGTPGRIEDGQVGVFLASQGTRNHALVDRALNLTKGRAGDAQ